MKHRTALAGVLAAASLLGTAGMAQATHHPERPSYSPCRPADTDGETRLGYSDEGGQDDPRHELPTIYANGDTSGGYIGICSGNSAGDPDQPPAQFLEVGDAEGRPYVKGSTPESPLEATVITPDNDFGSVTVGDDYIEVDGADESPLAGTVEQSDGYISAGTNEHTDDGEGGEPDVCMSGDHNRAYYDQPGYRSGQDCNAALADQENLDYITGLLTG